jgi:predicted NUDIX family phosphoesterase
MPDATSEPLTSTARMILAAAAAGLPADFSYSGFHPINSDQAVSTLQLAGLWIGPRDTLEESPDYRQIIPYIVLKCGDRFMRYTRTPAGGEARLHGRMSVGLGGHIDLSDVVCINDRVDLGSTVQRAAEREVEEELGPVTIQAMEWVGILVDNDSAVGRVHIGLVGLWTLLSPPEGMPEDAIGDVALCSLPALDAVRDRLEGWSELLLDYLHQVGAESRCEVRAA